jgi:hypothetical protein
MSPGCRKGDLQMFPQRSQKRSRLVQIAALGSALFSLGLGLPRPVQGQEPDPATQVYVSNISAGWIRGTGRKRQSVAVVDIVNGNGTPVNGAVVIGNWSGCFKLNGVSDTTETVCTTIGGEPMDCVDGRAIIWGKFHTCPEKNCLFTFTITSVQKDGMTYVPVDGKTSGVSWCNAFAARSSRGPKVTLASTRPVVTRSNYQMPTRRLNRWWRR